MLRLRLSCELEEIGIKKYVRSVWLCDDEAGTHKSGSGRGNALNIRIEQRNEKKILNRNETFLIAFFLEGFLQCILNEHTLSEVDMFDEIQRKKND